MATTKEVTKMSDTTLNATESGMLADIRLHDIVVGVDGSDESFAALRWAQPCVGLLAKHR